MKNLTKICLIFVFSLLMPLSATAEINLWSFGTDIVPTDGDIEFWQTWVRDDAILNHDIRAHDITYNSDGLHVKGWILEPVTAGPHPVIIYNKGGFASSTSFYAWWGWGGSFDSQGGPTFNQKELFQYANEGYVVIVTLLREQGKKKTLAGDHRTIPVKPAAVPSDASGPIGDVSGDPFVFTGDDVTDHYGGPEVNDVINLLPLIEKMDDPAGNGGIQIDVDLNRLFMVGLSRGSMETYIALRNLAEDRYSTLPKIAAAAAKAGISHTPQQQKENWEELNINHEFYAAKGQTVPEAARFVSAFHIGGNFGWTYPDDVDGPLPDPGFAFFDFYPDDDVITGRLPFPIWDDNDLLNDEWPELGTVDPPLFPHPAIYSENYFARSAALWTDFWAGSDIPMLLLHSKGDNTILWNHSQRLYDVATAVGNPDLYTLELLEASDINDPPCTTAYGGNELYRRRFCEHVFVFDNFGVDIILAWLADYDGDGVLNEDDACLITPAGEPVDPVTGCSIDELVPCDGPMDSETSWKNHGKYLSSLAHTAEEFVELGLITEAEKDAIMSAGAKSTCGNK